MNSTPPPPPANGTPYQTEQDTSHLKILSICHYINAGFALLGILFIIAHAAIMMTVFNSAEMKTEMDAEGMPFNPMNFFMIFYIIGAILMILSAVLNFLTARGLSARNRKTLIQITSGLNCLNVPLGTILGVFTFVVLGRPSVQALFNENTSN